MLLAVISPVTLLSGILQAAPAGADAWFHFHAFAKNRADVINGGFGPQKCWESGGYLSQCQWKPSGTGGEYYARAGSGDGSQNECYRNHGWTPDGWGWMPWATYNNGGTAVQGPAIRINDMTCYNGTVRTELFVHSSYPWTETRYHSLGCIKLQSTGGPSNAGGNIRTAVDFFNRWHDQWLLNYTYN